MAPVMLAHHAEQAAAAGKAIAALAAAGRRRRLPDVDRWEVRPMPLPDLSTRMTLIMRLCPEAGRSGAERWAELLTDRRWEIVKRGDTGQDGQGGEERGEFYVWGRYEGADVRIVAKLPPLPEPEIWPCGAEVIDGKLDPCYNPDCLDCASYLETRG